MSRPATRLLLPILMVLVPVCARARDDGADQRRTITVTGQAEAKGKPDRVTISFAVETVGARAADASAENAKRSAAVVDAVKRLVAADDIVGTAGYGVEPRYEQPKPGETQAPRITGYVVRNEVTVTSGRVDQAGALIDAAGGAGANRIGALQFGLAKRDELVRRSLEQAGADARAQADVIARGLGVRVKGLVSATTSPGVPMPKRGFEAMEMATARVATPIEAGDVTVTSVVQATWEVE
jgi:uncharacterized protein YggE